MDVLKKVSEKFMGEGPRSDCTGITTEMISLIWLGANPMLLVMRYVVLDTLSQTISKPQVFGYLESTG
jgi:hypothetical protein